MGVALYDLVSQGDGATGDMCDNLIEATLNSVISLVFKILLSLECHNEMS
jgi:hypothetical protein